MLQKTALALAFAALLSACASPHVVETARTTDSQLSCTQIEAEIREAERFRADAQKEKGMTGTNVAAVLFFWPAMIGTYSNANEAIGAADKRKAHLVGLYDQKSCSGKGAGAQNAEKTKDMQLFEIKDLREKNLITQEEYDAKRKKILDL